jgi:hypothetical protein
MMSDAGYSVYVVGNTTKDGVTKAFSWGFTRATRYLFCHSEQGGSDELGVTVTNDSETTVELAM